MKKLYLLLAVIFIGCTSFSASAVQWWISGAFNNWAHAQIELTPVDGKNGVFSTTLETLSGEFLICQGTKGTPDWDNKVGTNGQKVVADTPYTYKVGGGNFVMDGTVANPTVTLDTTAGTLLVAGKAQENDYDTVYIMGDINGSGWNENLTTYPLTLKSGTSNVWEGKFTFTSSANYFKMKAGSLVYGTGGGDINVVAGTEYTASQSGNAFVLGAGDYTFTYVLDKNADTGKLTVAGKVEYPESLYVIGNVNGGTWNPTNGVAMTTTAEGVYTATDVELKSEYGNGTAYFSFASHLATSDDWNAIEPRYGATSGNFTPSTTEANTIQGGENAFMIADGKYDITVSLVDMTMTIKAVEVAPVTYPETLYIIGTVNGQGFAANNGIEMTEGAETGLFSIDKVSIGGELGTEYGYFSFANVLGSTDSDYSAMTYRYGATENDFVPVLGAPNTIQRGENSFKIGSGDYKISIDLKAGEMIITKVETVVEPVEPGEAIEIGGDNLYGIAPADAEDAAEYWGDDSAYVGLAIVGEWKANTATPTTATLYKDGAVFKTVANTDEQYCQVYSESIMATEPNMEGMTNVMLVFSPDAPITEDGLYKMVIPEGFLINNGHPNAEFTYTWQLGTPAEVAYYLCGESTNPVWAVNPGEEYKFKLNEGAEGTEYMLTVPELKGSYKLSNGTEDEAWGYNGSSNLQLGVDYNPTHGTWANTGNIVIDGTILNATIYLKPQADGNIQLYVTSSTPYIVGDFNGSNNWNRTDFGLTTVNGDNYSATGLKLSGSGEGDIYFRVLYNGVSYGPAENDELVALGTAITTTANSGVAYKLDVNGTYAFNFNTANNQLIIQRTQADDQQVEITLPETLYMLIGEGNEWNIADPVAMEKQSATVTFDGNEYTDYYANVDLKAGDLFSFSIGKGGNWDNDINSANRWGAPLYGDVTISTDEKNRTKNELMLYQVGVNASSCEAYKVPAGTESGKYLVHVYLNKDNATPYVTLFKDGSTVSVAGIEADGEAAYYTLEGLKVAEPTNGLYIKVVNGKATKVLIRK